MDEHLAVVIDRAALRILCPVNNDFNKWSCRCQCWSSLKIDVETCRCPEPCAGKCSKLLHPAAEVHHYPDHDGSIRVLNVKQIQQTVTQANKFERKFRGDLKGNFEGNGQI